MRYPFSTVCNKEQLNQEVLNMSKKWRDKYQCVIDAINDGRISKDWKTAKEIGLNANKLYWSLNSESGFLNSVIELHWSNGVKRFRLKESWEN